jgi:tetratricopeptide (TPR) repeat protein
MPAMPTLTDAITNAFQAFTERQFDRSEWWCHQVLQVEPNRAEILNLLGSTCYQTGRLLDAVGWYREAVDAQPDDAEAYNNLGVVLQELGHLEVALAQFEAAIELAPEYTQAYFNLGNALNEDGQHDLAIRAYQKALSLDPNYTAARNNLAYLYQSVDDHQQAIALYRQTIAQNPESAIAYMNLANLLQEQGNLEGAMVNYEKAGELESGNANLLHNLGVAYQAMGDTDRAIQTYYSALQLSSRQAASHLNLGVLLRSHRGNEALAHLQQAITYEPDVAEAYYQIGLLWRDRMEIPAAISSFRQAVALDPDLADAHVALGETLLLIGKYPEGFSEYEWRWQSDRFLQTQLPRHRRILRWDGQDLSGKTVLLWAEQGVRETIQFARFVPQVMAMGGEVVVECDRELVTLLQRMTGLTQVIAKGDELPKCDLQAPFLSLPQILGTTIETIPAICTWPQPLQKTTNATAVKRIGIAWSDRNKTQENAQNSLPLEMLLNQLQEKPGIELINLQRFCRDDEKSQLVSYATLNPTLEWNDVLDVAKTICELDLVIAVDNEIAHLSASLGVATVILLPFSPAWYWTETQEVSPWYDAKLYRQTEVNNWQDTLTEIVDRLT